MSYISQGAPDPSDRWDMLRTHVEGLSLPSIGPVEREVLVALKLFGDLTVLRLAELLCLSLAAVRQHLRQLESERMVDHWTAPTGGSGRPPRVYSLSGRAQELFPTLSPAIGHIILGRLAQTDPQALETILREELTGAVRRAVVLDGGLPVDGGGVPRSEAVRFLKRAVSRWGYLPEVTEHGSDIEVVLHHCPFLQVVEALPAFCNLERDAFRVSLPDATPRRIAHRFSGDRVCAYLLQYPAASAGDGAP